MAHTVLVADDSKTIRQIVAMALKGAPYTLVEADSASALRSALGQNPDLVLLDYYMPDGDGMQLCRDIKSTTSVPVVMLGGTYKPFDPQQAHQAGADGVVMKPFKTDQLLDAMEAALSGGGASAAAPAPVAPQPTAATPPARPTPPASPFGQPSAPSGPPASPFGQPAAAASPSMPPNPFASGASAPKPAAPSVPQPTPEGSMRQSGSQPAISPSRSGAPSIPTTPTTPAKPAAPVAQATPQESAPASGGGSGMERAEMESFIQEQVRAVVKEELPGLLRNIMGDLLQQKLLPKILKHSEDRVNSLLNEQLTKRVQEQVRTEFEQLLSED